MQTVITCDQLIDGSGGAPLRDAAVVIEGERIVFAGPAADAPREPGQRVVQAPGGTVMPGLIDVHVHITYDGGLASKNQVLGGAPLSFADLALRGYANALRCLEYGYTTLRDVHAAGYADVALRNSIASGRLVGPRLFVCGQGLCITGGHMDKNIYPPHVAASGRVGVCDTPEGFRQAVRQHVKLGVDLIKINSDVGSLLDPNAPYRQEMSFAEMQAACDEAHKFGRHVAAHTSGGPPIEEALLAGVDTIEHGHWLTERAIELLLERGAFYVPTLIVNSKNFEFTREELGVTEQSWRWLQLAYEAKWGSLERARKAGVKIAAGSDAGFLVDHGENAAELSELVKGGLTPLEAIRAATATAAELLGVGDEIGTLAAGRRADVIVVDGDPLAEIDLLRSRERIVYVCKDGRQVKGPASAAPAL